ncbi:MAG: GDP-mannose 4,6-dehydratase [Planctomycetaceae bacterium]|jgi:GDP-4-dehydro-6-deoxy-D-mannose reductase|nr:GDP-mannose 4,6-dehydratase [Planctomycetaceae bacterium]
MERYLVTGVGGFVGQHFLRYLDVLGGGFEVIGVDRSFLGYEPLSYSFRFESVDLLDSGGVDDLVSGFCPDYLVHLAAVSGVGESWVDPRRTVMNNLGVLLNVLESVRVYLGESCRVLVVGSSEIYAESSEPLSESSPIAPKNPYSIARAAQENLINLYADNFGLDIVGTRSFTHIGPYQSDKFVVASFVRQLVDEKQDGKKIAVLKTGNINIERDFTDVRDVVRGYYLLLKCGVRNEIYNICSGNAISLKSVIDEIGSILQIPVSIEIDLKRLRPNDQQTVIGNNNKIKTTTGWQPEINLKKTLQDMIECAIDTNINVQ